MKRNQSNNHRPLLHVLGTAVLAAALVAGPGSAGVAFAVEPSPTPTPSSTLAPRHRRRPSAAGLDGQSAATAAAPATFRRVSIDGCALASVPSAVRRYERIHGAGRRRRWSRDGPAVETGDSFVAVSLQCRNSARSLSAPRAPGCRRLVSKDWTSAATDQRRLAAAVEHGRQVRLCEGERRQLLHQRPLQLAVPGITQRRHDPWRLPLCHPQLVLGCRPGALLC